MSQLTLEQPVAVGPYTRRDPRAQAASHRPVPVSSYTEWDPLEEVIVGNVAGALIPDWDFIDEAAYSREDYFEAHKRQGRPAPTEEIEAAARELHEFVRILTAEGVTVRRPAPMDQRRPYATPDWKWRSGYNCNNPRDVLLVVGNEIIEAPTPRRGRVYEANGYRPLLREYFAAGAKWTAAPKPIIGEDFYNRDITRPRPGEPLFLPEGVPVTYPHTELEPCFEAADFMRCGRDIFYHRSFVTNQRGVDWLQRHLGPQFRFHEIDTRCRRPIHIDTTFVPLAPGKALVNPRMAPKLPEILKKWDILWAPEPVPRKGKKSSFCFSSNWLSMNVFSLDPERVFVDSLQEEMLAKLRDWGFKPIPLPFQSVYPFGGGLHCCTLDVRRRGTLQSYF